MDGQTDRQTDVGHINLIGGLVTRNPPKKMSKKVTWASVYGPHTQVKCLPKALIFAHVKRT